MTKLEAFNGIISGEFTTITFDHKAVYALVEGSIVTPRKKALDMKNLMEDGWIGISAPKWKENIGEGVLLQSGETLYIAKMLNDHGNPVTATGKNIPKNAEPVELSDISDYIWNPTLVAEKKYEEEDLDVSPKKVKERVALSKSEKIDHPTNEEVELNPKNGDIEEAIPCVDPDTEGQVDDGEELEVSLVPKKKPKLFKDSTFFMSLKPFFELGLEPADAETFWNFNELDKFKIDDIINKGEDEITRLIDIFYEVPEEHVDPSVNITKESDEVEEEIPFSQTAGSAVETKKPQQSNIESTASPKGESTDSTSDFKFRGWLEQLGLPNGKFSSFWNHLRKNQLELDDLRANGDEFTTIEILKFTGKS